MAPSSVGSLTSAIRRKSSANLSIITKQAPFSPFSTRKAKLLAKRTTIRKKRSTASRFCWSRASLKLGHGMLAFVLIPHNPRAPRKQSAPRSSTWTTMRLRFNNEKNLIFQSFKGSLRLIFETSNNFVPAYFLLHALYVSSAVIYLYNSTATLQA